MPQEITRTQIEKYTVYTGPTAESFSPIMAGITYPDPAYEILVYRRPLCVFEYVLSGCGHIERNGSILTVNAGDAYILTAGTYHHYYSDKVDPWTKIWFNVSGSLVQHLLSDYGLDGVTLIPRFHNETPLTRILDAFTADPVHSADKLAVLLHQYIQELADFLANKVPINPTALAIRNYILQEVDYIVFAPVVESGWDEVLQESQEAGIPVIVVDRMVDVGDDSLFAAWVGSDFRREGQTAVNWLAHYLEEQGRDGEDISILHVQGTEGSSAQIGRTAGLLEGVKEHSNWHILRQVEGEFTKAKSYEVVSAVLKEREIPDVVYCENDESALGAVQALDEYGITHGPDGDVIVISFDATRAGLTACMNREINLDMECNPLHGPRVEALIRQIEAGETPNQYCYVEETWFTPEELTEERIAKREY